MANTQGSPNVPGQSGNQLSPAQQAQPVNSTVTNAGSLENKKDAIKTYIEQTKLLITLASAFIIAPAVVFKDLASVDHATLIWMEVFFIGSVLSSYVTMGAITGTQNKGEYDVDRLAIRIWSFAQLGCYLIGVGIFILSLLHTNVTTKPAAYPKTDTTKTQTIINKSYHQQVIPSVKYYRKKQRNHGTKMAHPHRTIKTRCP